MSRKGKMVFSRSDLEEAFNLPVNDYFTETMKKDLLNGIREHLIMHEMDHVRDQAARQFVKNATMRYYKSKLSAGEVTGVPIIDRMPDEIKKFMVEKVETSKAYMITINAKDEIDPKEFWRRVTEFTTRNDFLEWKIYTLEQRSEKDQDAYGWHIHIIAESSLPKCRMVDKIYKSFNRFVSARNYIDVQKIVADMDTRIEYVKGNKKESKMGKVDKDKILKERLGIPMFVEKN